MAVTNLDIVNRALNKIGAQPASSMSDTAKAASRAILAYTTCRDEVMRLVEWPSCTTRVRLKSTTAQATPWTALTKYFLGARCTNDSGKTYQVTTAGKSAAATGPTGTSGSITDGTVVWKYVETSSTSNNWCWAASTAYAVNDLVAWDTGKIYACITAGTSNGSGGPTGTSSDITDGTAHWRYYGTIIENLTVSAYPYVLPPDCLHIIKIPSSSAVSEDQPGVQYRREGIFLYCAQSDSSLKYVKAESDPTLWDELLRETVALKIATVIAYDITGKYDLANKLFQEYAGAFGSARSISVGEGSAPPAEEPRWEDVG